MKPSIRTFLTVLTGLVSIVVYGQDGLRTTTIQTDPEHSTSSDISGYTIQVNPIKKNAFSAPLVEQNEKFQEIIEGIECVTLTYYENDGVVPIEDELTVYRDRS